MSSIRIEALKNYVLVTDMNFGERTLSNGLKLLNDDLRSAGIRPRWAKVYAIGPDQKDVSIGQWILITHGRWTRGVEIEDEIGKITIRRVDVDDILLVSDTQPIDDNLSDQLQVDSKTRW